jgi:hypothetical protein
MGAADASARVAEYGGQGWRVTWTHTTGFPNVYNVRGSGTATAGAAVEVTETLAWEAGSWHMAPLPVVVPRPSNTAETTPPS